MWVGGGWHRERKSKVVWKMIGVKGGKEHVGVEVKKCHICIRIPVNRRPITVSYDVLLLLKLYICSRGYLM